VSLRAFNRNFKGRSGLPDDSVYLVPEVVAASAIAGEIVDPRDLDADPPSVSLPADMTRTDAEILGPDPSTEVVKGDTIGTVPLEPPLADDVDTGRSSRRRPGTSRPTTSCPRNAEVMSLWSDPQACADYTLVRVDEAFPEKARAADGGWVVAGENYGQGRAARTPRSNSPCSASTACWRRALRASTSRTRELRRAPR